MAGEQIVLDARGKTVAAKVGDPRKGSKGRWVCTYMYRVGRDEYAVDESCGYGAAVDYLPGRPSLARVHGSANWFIMAIPLVMGGGGVVAFSIEALQKRRATRKQPTSP